MTRPEIEPRSPGHLANTLPLGQWAGQKLFVCLFVCFVFCFSWGGCLLFWGEGVTKVFFLQVSTVHQPRKQCLVNRDRHRLAISKSMDSYRVAIGHMEDSPDR